MRIRSLVAAGALVANTVPVAAQDEEPRAGFYLAPIVHGVRTDRDRGVDDAAAFTLDAGLQVHPRWDLELNLFRGHFDRESGGRLDLEAAGLNVLRVFRRDAMLAPYALLGFGAQRAESRPNDSSTDGYADAGLGLLTTFRRSDQTGAALSLRFDARARYDRAQSEEHLDYLLGVGLRYAFGSTPARPVAASVPVQAAVPAEPADEDRDGVLDRDDRCPGTLQGRTVGADGCEPDVDADDDSVANNVDACPDTPQGTRTDARGCELRHEIRLPLVTFEYGSDRLKPEASKTLDEAVATLRLNPDVSVEVAGHTDGRGSGAYNLDLSQRRAEAVRLHLIERGVANVLTARGYGEREPIADNMTEAGRAENRRVVLRMLAPPR
jgi:OOP family OmpA-OmpF porin